MNRVRNGTWRVDDLRETLRIGLIGGGKAPTEALTLIQRYFDDRPLMENKAPAYAVLLAVLLQPDGDKLAGKARRRGEKQTAGESPSRDSSEQPAQSA